MPELKSFIPFSILSIPKDAHRRREVLLFISSAAEQMTSISLSVSSYPLVTNEKYEAPDLDIDTARETISSRLIRGYVSADV